MAVLLAMAAERMATAIYAGWLAISAGRGTFARTISPEFQEFAP
jgi:hypothetical protein